MLTGYYVRIDEEHGCRITVSDEPWKGDVAVLNPEDVTPELLTGAARRKCALPWMIAETERLLVRELMPDDLGALQEMSADLSERGLLGEEENIFLSRDSLNAYIAAQYPFFGFGIWGIVERKSGQLIGKAGFSAPQGSAAGNPDEADGALPEFSYHIAGPYRRRGYALEACRALLAYGERELGLHGCRIRIDRSNEASLKFAGILKTSLPSGEGRFRVCISVL